MNILYKRIACHDGQCGNLWPNQDFSTQYAQNTVADSVLRIWLSNYLCTLASIWLLRTSKIIVLEQNDDKKIFETLSAAVFWTYCVLKSWFGHKFPHCAMVLLDSSQSLMQCWCKNCHNKSIRDRLACFLAWSIQFDQNNYDYLLLSKLDEQLD